MKKNFKKIFIFFIMVSVCVMISACDVNSKTDDSSTNNDADSEIVLYTDFGDRLYYKDNIYHPYITMDNERFDFHILANKIVTNVTDVMFFNGENPVDCSIAVIPYHDIHDSKKIRDNLYLTDVKLKLFIRNIDGVRITKISLNANGVPAEYSVDISFNYYYLNPEYNFSTKNYAFFEGYDGEHINIKYWYNAFLVSRFNHAVSMMSGIKIEKVYIAEYLFNYYGLPQPPFVEVGNDDTNILEYDSYFVMVKYDCTEIKQEALFFANSIKINITINGESVDVFWYYQGTFEEIYKELCSSLQI